MARFNRSVALPDDTPVEMVVIAGIRVRADDKAGQERAREAAKMREAEQEARAEAAQPVEVLQEEPEPPPVKKAAAKKRAAPVDKARKTAAANK